MRKLRKKTSLVEEIIKLFVNYLLTSFPLSLGMDNLVIRLLKLHARNCYKKEAAPDIYRLSAFMFIFLLFLISIFGQLDPEIYVLMFLSVLTGMSVAPLILKPEYKNKPISEADKILDISRV